MSKQTKKALTLKVAKSGRHPDHNNIISSRVNEVIKRHPELRIPQTESLGYSVMNSGIKVYTLKDGNYLLEYSETWPLFHPIKNFWIISDSLDDVIKRAYDRISRARRGKLAAETRKMDKNIRTQLEERFGKVFTYRVISHNKDKSFHIFHKLSGIRIRVGNDYKPSFYTGMEFDLELPNDSNTVSAITRLIYNFLRANQR